MFPSIPSTSLAAFYISGDVFDEGQWVDQKEYEEYVERFYRLFPTQNPYVLVGNHDVGFHNM